MYRRRPRRGIDLRSTHGSMHQRIWSMRRSWIDPSLVHPCVPWSTSNDRQVRAYPHLLIESGARALSFLPIAGS